MNANLLHLLLAIVFTASITGIHAYRTGDLDRQLTLVNFHHPDSRRKEEQAFLQ
uniref:Uncharacterized protein n=1 Tax=Schistosoma haematobium TaxID=6185 RepID=A0A094ZP92_SCHHA